MKTLISRVADGKIEVGGDLPEGTPVAILAVDDESGFEVSAEDEEELLAALEDIRAGNYVDGREFLRKLRQTGDC
jgi:hypothetical protein